MARPDNFTPGTPGGGRPDRPDVGKTPGPTPSGGSGSSVGEFLSWAKSLDLSNYDVTMPRTRKTFERWVDEFRDVVGSGMGGRDIPIDKPKQRSRVLIMEKYIADQLGLDTGTITPEQFKSVVGESFDDFGRNMAAKTATSEPTPDRVAAMGGENDSRGPAVLNLADAAKYLGYDEDVVQELVEEGKIFALDVAEGRMFKREELDRYFEDLVNEPDDAPLAESKRVAEQPMPSGTTPETIEARIRKGVEEYKKATAPSEAEKSGFRTKPSERAVQAESERLKEQGMGDEDWDDTAELAEDNLTSRAEQAKEQLNKVQRTPDSFDSSPVNQGATPAGGESRSWYSEPFKFGEVPTASKGLYEQLEGVIDASMTNDQARLALRKFANQLSEFNPTLKAQVENYLVRFKKLAAEQGNLSEAQLAAFDSDAAAPTQDVTAAVDAEVSVDDTRVPIADRNDPLGIVKRVQTQSSPAAGSPTGGTDAPSGRATAAPGTVRPVRLTANDVIAIQELPTRSHEKLVREGSQTHMPFVVKVQAISGGETKGLPLRGTLHQSMNSFLFRHTADDGTVLGYYEIPTTAEFSRPKEIEEGTYMIRVNSDTGNPEFDGPKKPVSDTTDYDGHKALMVSQNRIKSGSPSVAIGEKPDLPQTSEEPTLSNDAPSDWRGNKFNPNATPDLIRSILGIPQRLQQTDSMLLRGAGTGLEALIDRVAGKPIRKAASNQVVPGTPDAVLPPESRVAMSRPLNSDRINQVLGSLNTEGVNLSAEDYGVIYQAFRTDPDGLYDALLGATNRGDDANAAIIRRMAEAETDLYKKRGLLGQVETMRSSASTRSQALIEMLYDSNGVPKRNVEKFATLVDGAMQEGARPDNFETLMAIEAISEGDPRSLTSTAYGPQRQNILENEQVSLNEEEAASQLKSSSRLAGDTRKFQKAMDGSGLLMYGPASKTKRQDAAVSIKLEEARQTAQALRQAELKVMEIAKAANTNTDGGAAALAANNPELAEVMARRDELFQQLRQQSKEIGRLMPTQSANEAFTGYVTGNLNSQNPSGGRVTRKTIEDADNPEYEGDAPESGDTIDISGSSDGYGSFKDGILAMMTRMDPEAAKTKVAAALSGNREVLKEFGVRTPGEFRNLFARVYMRSPLSRMGGEVVTPEVGFDAGATSREGGVLFPSVGGLDTEEAFRLLDLQNSLRQQLKDELSILKAVGFGRGDEARNKGYGLFGSRGLEYKNRRAASFRNVEKLRKELEMVNAELDKHPELKEVFDKTNGMLDEIAGERQVSVEETRALERKLEMGQFQNPAQPFNEVRLGQLMGVNPILNAPDIAKPTIGNRISQLRDFLDPRSEVTIPDNSSADLENFLTNYDLGKLPDERKSFMGVDLEKGNLPTANEGSVQDARLKFNDEDVTILRAIQAGDTRITPEQQRAVLAKLTRQAQWVDLTLQQSFISSTPDKPLPPTHVSKGSLDGSDSDELVPNPAYTRELTSRAETPEEQQEILTSLQPILNYKTQLLNITRNMQRAPIRAEIGAGGSNKPVKLRTADDFKNVPESRGLGALTKDPRNGLRPDQIEALQLASDGIPSVYASPGSAADTALGGFTGDNIVRPTSFMDDVKVSAGDQQVEILKDLEKHSRLSGYEIGDLSHLYGADQKDVLFALENIKRGIIDNIRTDDMVGANEISNAESSRRATGLVDQATAAMFNIQDKPSMGKAAIYDKPMFEDGAFIIKNDDGGRQAYIIGRYPEVGFNQFGQTGVPKQTAYIPVGLDPGDIIGSGSEALLDGTPTFSKYDLNNGKLIRPKVDFRADNQKAVVENMTQTEDGRSLDELTPEERLARASAMTGDEAATKRAAAAQDGKDVTQSTYKESVDSTDTDTPNPDGKPEATPETRIQKLKNNLKQEFTPGKMTGRAILGGAVGFGISELYRRQQEQEAARNNMISMPPLTTDKTPEEELIERLRGQRKLKSMTTQVPVMGSGVR